VCYSIDDLVSRKLGEEYEDEMGFEVGRIFIVPPILYFLVMMMMVIVNMTCWLLSIHPASNFSGPVVWCPFY
jgi:hypothetical protein